MVERGGLPIEATIGVITRRYNLSGINFTPSSLNENILRLSVIVEMTEATRSTRGNSNFPKKGKKSLSKYCLFEKKAKISRVTRVIYRIPGLWSVRSVQALETPNTSCRVRNTIRNVDTWTEAKAARNAAWRWSKRSGANVSEIFRRRIPMIDQMASAR